MSYVKRWTFTDTVNGDTAVVPINPNKMSSPTSPRNMTWAWGSYWGTDRMRGIDLPSDQPPEWTFSGVLLTKGHYDLLLDWTKRMSVLHVTDHLERTFEIIISRFDPVERPTTARSEWRADYTMTCLLLKEVTA